jgi:hypothetical protein
LYFKPRSIGAVGAAYDVLGLHKQSSDTDVLFLDTALSDQRSLTIKKKLVSGETIYNDPIGKHHYYLLCKNSNIIINYTGCYFLFPSDIYLQRPSDPEFQSIIYPDYFANYTRSYNKNVTNEIIDQNNRKWRKRLPSILIRYRYKKAVILLTMTVFLRPFRPRTNQFMSLHGLTQGNLLIQVVAPRELHAGRRIVKTLSIRRNDLTELCPVRTFKALKYHPMARKRRLTN